MYAEGQIRRAVQGRDDRAQFVEIGRRNREPQSGGGGKSSRCLHARRGSRGVQPGEFEFLTRSSICALNACRHGQLARSRVQWRIQVEHERDLGVAWRTLPAGIERAGGESRGPEVADWMGGSIESSGQRPGRNVAQTKMHDAGLH
jgi:hypothetical protein